MDKVSKTERVGSFITKGLMIVYVIVFVGGLFFVAFDSKFIDGKTLEQKTEEILDIQFEQKEGFWGTSNIIVKTNVQTHVFYNIDFALTKRNTSYLQTEKISRGLGTDTIKTIFVSQDDFEKYSEAYAKEFGVTWELDEIEEVEELME